MSENFATVEDVELLWRKLTPEEKERATALIPIVADSLRNEAIKVNKNLGKMIQENPSLLSVARTLLTSTTDEPMVQTSQSALGYSFSGTYLVPGGGLFIKKNELARLGLRRQKMGVIDLYGDD